MQRPCHVRMVAFEEPLIHLQCRFKLGQRLRRSAQGAQAIGHVVQARRHVGMIAGVELLVDLQCAPRQPKSLLRAGVLVEDL